MHCRWFHLDGHASAEFYDLPGLYLDPCISNGLMGFHALRVESQDARSVAMSQIRTSWKTTDPGSARSWKHDSQDYYKHCFLMTSSPSWPTPPFVVVKPHPARPFVRFAVIYKLGRPSPICKALHHYYYSEIQVHVSFPLLQKPFRIVVV